MRARRAESPEHAGNSSTVARVRRGLGAPGHSCIVPWCARSPTRSAAEGHARRRSALVRKCVSAGGKRLAPSALTHSRTHALTHSRTHALTHSRTLALSHSRTLALSHSRTLALTHFHPSTHTEDRGPRLVPARRQAQQPHEDAAHAALHPPRLRPRLRRPRIAAQPAAQFVEL